MHYGENYEQSIIYHVKFLRNRVRHLSSEILLPGLIVGRNQLVGGGIMLWAIFSWKELGTSVIHCEK